MIGQYCEGLHRGLGNVPGDLPIAVARDDHLGGGHSREMNQSSNGGIRLLHNRKREKEGRKKNILVLTLDVFLNKDKAFKCHWLIFVHYT